jgi:hypothetical protein
MHLGNWARAFLSLWRPLRVIATEIQGIRVALEKIAALDAQIAEWRLRQERQEELGRPAAPENGEEPAVDVGFTSDAEQADYERVAREFYQASGRMPDEEELLEEIDRRRGLPQ